MAFGCVPASCFFFGSERANGMERKESLGSVRDGGWWVFLGWDGMVLGVRSLFLCRVYVM